MSKAPYEACAGGSLEGFYAPLSVSYSAAAHDALGLAALPMRTNAYSSSKQLIIFFVCRALGNPDPTCNPAASGGPELVALGLGFEALAEGHVDPI